MSLLLSGSATLRTPDGLEEMYEGEIMFFEAGATGVHQLYNHTEKPCTYLDLRSSIGYDVCEYLDSDQDTSYAYWGNISKKRTISLF